MSAGTAIFVIPLIVSYVTRISGVTIHHTASSLAGEAPELRFEPAIEWYREGMQLFAFRLKAAKWNKSHITWGIEKDSKKLSRQTVIEAATAAFEKWSAASSLHFTGPVRQPDIRIKFVPAIARGLLALTYFVGEGHYENGVKILDHEGARAQISDDFNWTDPEKEDYFNIHNMLLHEIGHCLGLDTSRNRHAVMNCGKRVFRQPLDINLQTDDIKGIRIRYAPPPQSRTPSNTPQPPSSRPSHSQFSPSSSRTSGSFDDESDQNCGEQCGEYAAFPFSPLAPR